MQQPVADRRGGGVLVVIALAALAATAHPAAAQARSAMIRVSAYVVGDVPLGVARAAGQRSPAGEGAAVPATERDEAVFQVTAPRSSRVAITLQAVRTAEGGGGFGADLCAAPLQSQPCHGVRVAAGETLLTDNDGARQTALTVRPLPGSAPGLARVTVAYLH